MPRITTGPRIKITTDNMRKLANDVRKLSKLRVLVGVPDDRSDRKDNNGTPTQINNAAIAYVQTFGNDQLGIPPRPFLEEGILMKRDEIEKLLRATAEKVLNGKDVAINGLTAVGLVAQAAVRNKITVGPFIPLAPATIAARLSRGRTGTRPLIDTGQLRNSINFVIVKS